MTEQTQQIINQVQQLPYAERAAIIAALTACTPLEGSDHAAIAEGISQMHAGQTMTIEEAREKTRQRFNR